MRAEELDQHLDDAFKVALFRALSQASEGYVSCIDRQRRVLFLNRTLSRELGRVLGQRMEEFIAPPQRATVIERVEQAFQTGEPQRLEYSVELSGGGPHFIRTRIHPFQSPQGEPLALMLTEDISDQHQLALELERSTMFRRQVVEHLPDFIVLLDREQRIVWVNRVAAVLSPERVIGAKIDAFMTTETAPRASRAIEAAFATGAVSQFETEGTGEEAPLAWYQMRVFPVRKADAVEKVLLIATEITERKRAERALRETEEQLHRAQRLESLGQLSGGIAHDFNNLLQVIDGNLTFAQERLQRGLPVTEELEQALRATERASELTSHLLAIGRRKRMDPKCVDLAALVAHSVRMLRRAIPENVELVYEAPPQPLFAELDAPQFEQVLINLCVNARDAMPAGGLLRVEVSAEDQAQLVLRVSDTGVGIAPQNLQRVFEPFFTTKGAGSGLGLAAASGIVAAHGGVIIAESDGRSGTRMIVRLPRVEAAPTPAVAPRQPALGGDEVILVAEDEPMVRTQLVRVLTHAGYMVLEAENGAKAVELFRANQGKIDAVLLDMIMPGLDGWQAFLQIEAIAPGIKVLFSTGYAANVLPADFAARGARLLSKPYRPNILLSQLRELLDADADVVRLPER